MDTPPPAPPARDLMYQAMGTMNGKMLVVAVVVLVGVILLILAMHLYAKWMWRGVAARQISLRRRRFAVPDASLATPVLGGLDRATIEAFPTFKYSVSEQKGEQGVTECAVCLCEFEEGEAGRLLPKCNHGFHADCIDMWLYTHSTCPVCRDPLGAVGTGENLDEGSGLPDITVVGGGSPRASGTHTTHASVLLHLNQLASFNERQAETAAARAVQFPNNVLFWGNQSQCNAQTNSASSTGVAPAVASSSPASMAREHLSIDIPQRPHPATILLGTSGALDDVAGSPGKNSSSSGPQLTPATGRLSSLRRLLSRERTPKPAAASSEAFTGEDIEQGSAYCVQQAPQ